MSAFSTVGYVFSDVEFAAPGNAHWSIGGLDDSHKDRTGFLIMPRRPFTWRAQEHGCFKFDNEALQFAPSDLTAHNLVFFFFRVTPRPQQCHTQRPSPAHSPERAEGKQERKRLRKRLAQQSTPSESSTQP